MLLTCYSNVRSLHRHAHTCSQKKPTEITKNMCLCLCVRVCGSKLYIHEASTTMGPQASSTESIHHITSSERGVMYSPKQYEALGGSVIGSPISMLISTCTLYTKSHETVSCPV